MGSMSRAVKVCLVALLSGVATSNGAYASTPVASATPSSSPSPSATPHATASTTPAPSASSHSPAVAAPHATATPTPTATPTATPTPTPTATATATATTPHATPPPHALAPSPRKLASKPAKATGKPLLSARTRPSDSATRHLVAAGPTLDDLTVGAESPELRALRDAERELFPPATPSLGDSWPTELPSPLSATEDAPHVHASGLPPTPPASTPPAAVGGHDLAWLSQLEMPDLPVRWDARVVRFL